MKTFIILPREKAIPLPPPFDQEDVRSSPRLVECFVKAYTKPGETVFDPFCGFGTTVLVAEKMGRIGYGVEFLPERVACARSIVGNKENILQGNALRLSEMDLPPLDFSFSSPPYMSRNDHDEYPFAAYRVTGQKYDDYLLDIQSVYRQLKDKLKPNAYAVVEISNIVHHGVLTPLAWDVAQSIGEVLAFRGETVVAWEGETPGGSYGFGYDHCYCLAFQNAAP